MIEHEDYQEEEEKSGRRRIERLITLVFMS